MTKIHTIISKADNDITELWCEIINSTESVYIDDEQTYQSVSTLVETNQGDLLKELFNTLKESENEGKRTERLREGYTKVDERLLDNL